LTLSLLSWLSGVKLLGWMISCVGVLSNRDLDLSWVVSIFVDDVSSLDLGSIGGWPWSLWVDFLTLSCRVS
jgi:hypothetical protein